jgi:hypothetical protein
VPFEQIPKVNTIRAEEILRTITEELQQRIRKLKKKTAPGLDGVEVRHLQVSNTTIVLRYLYNILLISSLQPTEWRTNRTTLIPKPGKDTSRAENHRPLTIGSLISRIFWGIINQRLREKATFSPREKGFVSEAGCFDNVHIPNEIISVAKPNEGMIGIQLDVSKAFDTIPHEAIGPALRRQNMPNEICQTITDSHRRLSTRISCKGQVINIEIKRGVKQGDPLSPFIFNTLVNPLLEQLEAKQGFKLNENHSISCLAFAEDLILLAVNDIKARQLLRLTESYFGQLGMRSLLKNVRRLELPPQRIRGFSVTPTSG